MLKHTTTLLVLAVGVLWVLSLAGCKAEQGEPMAAKRAAAVAEAKGAKLLSKSFTHNAVAKIPAAKPGKTGTVTIALGDKTGTVTIALETRRAGVCRVSRDAPEARNTVGLYRPERGCSGSLRKPRHPAQLWLPWAAGASGGRNHAMP